MSVDPAREYGGGIRRLEIVSLGHGSSAPKLLVLQIGNSPTLPDPTDNGRIRHFRCVGGRRHGGIASCTPARRSRLLLLPTHRKEAQGPGEDDGLFQIREVQTRVFDEPDKLAAVISFYEALTGGRCSLRFPFPARRLELIGVLPAGILSHYCRAARCHCAIRLNIAPILVDDITLVAPHN